MHKLMIVVVLCGLGVGCDAMPSPSAPSSTFHVSPVRLELTGRSQQATIRVVSPQPWSVSSYPPWVSVSPQSGTRDGVITLTAEAHLCTSRAREGAVVIEGYIVRVWQDGSDLGIGC